MARTLLELLEFCDTTRAEFLAESVTIDARNYRFCQNLRIIGDFFNIEKLCVTTVVAQATCRTECLALRLEF
jgi:hypothetical protein